MDYITRPSPTYNSNEELILDYIEELNQGFAAQFSDYLKEIYSEEKKENNK